MLSEVRSTEFSSSLLPMVSPYRAFAYSHDDKGFATEHERATRRELASRLAALKGIEFGGECDARSIPDGNHYLVPGDTLVGELAARRLGIVDHTDLFGGVVPFAFVASKAITHPLVFDDAAAPAGWCPEFARRVRDSVPDGWTAFTIADAMVAGERLLAGGPVRVKSVRATAGRGQWVVEDSAALQRCLAAVDAAELTEHGLVLEQNLQQVETFSVGQVWVDDLVASYHGSQRLTRDNEGETVYGGSTLQVTRGDFDGLLAGRLGDDIRLAVEQASRYHAAALDCFAGMVVSRINYDIVRGRDAQGNWRSGVLEQSWRVGGASGAEIAALEHFSAHPQCEVVTTASYEVYGACEDPPPDAAVYFRGHDPKVGMLTKYSLVQTNGHT